MLNVLVPFIAMATATPPSASCQGLPEVRICEPLTRAPKAGVFPLDKGKFTSVGWELDTENSQLRYDLGATYQKGVVEFEMKGPLAQEGKRVVFGAWPNKEAVETPEQKEKERTAAFFQVRLQQRGMMLRLTHRPGGKSFEGLVKDLPLSSDRFHHVKATWDTTGGESRLWLDGKEISVGRFNAAFPGFRWVFLGRDNYRANMSKSIPGMVLRNFKVYGLESAKPPRMGRKATGR